MSLSVGVVIKISVQTTKKEKGIGKKAKAAGTKIGTGIRNAFALAGKTLKKHRASSEKIEYDSAIEESETASSKSEIERPGDPFEESPVMSTQIDQSIGEGNGSKENTRFPAEKKIADDFQLECLTCENLIHCEIRSTSPSKWKEQTKNGEYCHLVRMR